MFVRAQQNPRTQPSRTSVKSVRNSIRARSRFLLSGHEFVKFASVDYPAEVVRSFLNISQKLFILVMPWTFGACVFVFCVCGVCGVCGVWCVCGVCGVCAVCEWFVWVWCVCGV